MLIIGKLTNYQINTGYRKDPEQRKNSRKPKAIPMDIKVPVTLTQKQTCFDFPLTRIPPEKIDRQLNTILLNLWKSLKQEQQFRPVSTIPLSVSA